VARFYSIDDVASHIEIPLPEKDRIKTNAS